MRFRVSQRSLHAPCFCLTALLLDWIVGGFAIRRLVQPKSRMERGCALEISFRSTKLRKVFESEASLKRKYGARATRAIMMRLNVLQTLSCLAKMPSTKPERCHQLRQDRDEQFAIDLVHPFRLVFEVAHYPIPRDKHGGIDKEQVLAIMIVDVIDYH